MSIDLDASLLDPRICAMCPLGPEPATTRFCARCMADAAAIKARTLLADELRPRLTYDGVWYADAIKYDVLPNLLPKEDPAEEACA